MTDQLVETTPGTGPARSRSPDLSGDVGAGSERAELRRLSKLFLNASSEAGASGELPLYLPPCPRFYAQGVIEGPRKLFERMMDSRGWGYLQGATWGVGASTLIEDSEWVDGAEAGGGRWPFLHCKVSRVSKSVSHLLDALGARVGIPFAPHAARYSCPMRLATEVVDKLVMLRVQVLVLDHVHHLLPEPLGLVEEIVREGRGHIGFVLSAPEDPRKVLRGVPGLTSSMTHDPVLLRPYGEADILEILPQVGLAPPTIDVDDPADADLAHAVWKVTRGHVARMEPLFRTMLALQRPGEPADAELVHTAAAFAAGMTELKARQVPEGERRWSWEPDVSYSLAVDSLPSTREGEPKPKELPDGPPIATERERRLRHERDQAARAETIQQRETRPRRKRRRNER